MPDPELWRLLEENLAALADATDYRRCPPERRQRTMFALDAVRELRRRGRQTAMLDPSEGRASSNAIYGSEA